jgi:hypothetical protein
VRFRGLFLLALVAGLALFAPGLASAAVRVALITDPQDAPAPAEGPADLKSLEVEYDSNAGSVTATASFYQSVKGRTADVDVRFHLGSVPGPTYACAHNLDVPLATGIMYVRQGVDLLEIERVDTVLQSVSSSLSADGLTFTATWVSRPNLSGKDYRCADVDDVFMTTYTNPTCNYLSCPTTDTELDPVFKNAWFNGFAPVPAAPTNVEVATASGNSIALQWRDNDTSVTGYEVLRDDQVIGTTDKTSFTVPGLSCGHAYTLSVRADTKYTHSSATSISASTRACPPKAPAHLSVRATSTSVTVSWGASANATSYVVVVGSRTYRTTAKHLTVSRLHCGQSVTVKVRAIGPGGTSTPVAATTRTRHC